LSKSYKIDIHASRGQVWHALWNMENYLKWAEVFHEGSYVITDQWKKGSRVHFLIPEGSGMWGDISEHIENQIMQFTHQGEIKNFKEMPQESWAGSTETYVLTEQNGITTLEIIVSIYDAFAQFFDHTIPLALQKIKEISEKQ